MFVRSSVFSQTWVWLTDQGDTNVVESPVCTNDQRDMSDVHVLLSEPALRGYTQGDARKEVD